MKKARYSQQQRIDPKGRLAVSIKAENMLRDVMLQTSPHVDGHFDLNYSDLEGGKELIAHFIPRDPKADLSQVTVTVKTLNDIYEKY